MNNRALLLLMTIAFGLNVLPLCAERADRAVPAFPSGYWQEGIISGVVRDRNGNGIAAAQLSLLQEGRQISLISSDAQGGFVFRRLPAGDYDLHVSVGNQEYLKSGIKVRIARLSFANITAHNWFISKRPTANWEIVPGSIYIERPIPVAGPYAAPQPPPCEPEEYIPSMPSRFISPINHELAPLPFNPHTAGYTNLRRHLNNGQIPPSNSIRLEELYNYFDYYYPKAAKEHPYSVTMEMAPVPWNQKRDLLMIGVKAQDSLPIATAPANLTFLVDVSGSMATEHKLPMIKAALLQMVPNLRKQDRIAIIAYNADKAWFLGSAAGFETDAINAAIAKLAHAAPAEGDGDISLAYAVAREHFTQKAQNKMIHCSDGDFSFGPSFAKLEEMVADQAAYGISFHTLGFGMGQYRDPNLRSLAAAGRGSYFYIDSVREAERAFSLLIFKGSQIVTEELRMDLSFSPALVKAYRYLGFSDGRNGAAEADQFSFHGINLESGQSYTFFFELIPMASKEQVPGLEIPVIELEAPDPQRKALGIWASYTDPDTGNVIRNFHAMGDAGKSLEAASERFCFATAVLGFGLKLQAAEANAALSWPLLKAMAEKAKAEDQDGSRAEFIRLIDTAARLQER